ncbi:hypothetical protein [Kitasatospora sp. NPDC085879]|uniref:hypothetical protein n=1 Tax=Kitasatospora sp. NPDC085879 TaxID=3154769 RepID=UPI000BB0CF7F|nr:hypothetical protein [Streptomyces sp. TLI_235]PBC70028.1 hypothetical protein BX265_7413 [Streptomyces sp. TLI_235]
MRSGVQGKIALLRAPGTAASDDVLASRLRRLAARADRHAEILDNRQADAAEVLRRALARGRRAAQHQNPVHGRVPAAPKQA